MNTGTGQDEGLSGTHSYYCLEDAAPNPKHGGVGGDFL